MERRGFLARMPFVGALASVVREPEIVRGGGVPAGPDGPIEPGTILDREGYERALREGQIRELESAIAQEVRRGSGALVRTLEQRYGAELVDRRRAAPRLTGGRR